MESIAERGVHIMKQAISIGNQDYKSLVEKVHFMLTKLGKKSDIVICRGVIR